MRKIFIGVTAAVLFALPTLPVLAGEQDAPPPLIDEETIEMAKDGMEQVLRAIQQMMEQMPRYGVPQMDEEGNIIIPRLNPREEDFDGEADDTAV